MIAPLPGRAPPYNITMTHAPLPGRLSQDALAKLAAVTSEMQEGQAELRQQSARLMDMRQQVSGLQETMAALGAEKEALKVRYRCWTVPEVLSVGMSWSVV